MRISVCIATYRRPERLGDLLGDLARQKVLPDQVVVVDNDASGSARDVIQRHQALGSPFPIDYDIQPQRNIALTRNRTVALAKHEWLAFVDDDERAPEGWLSQLLAAVTQYQADGILGPVVPRVPSDAPAWIRRGRFYDFPRMVTGEEVPLNRMRFGNVLLRADPVRAQPGPFDLNYGLTTGEDADLLIRMVRAGARIIWCDEAIVDEPVEPARLSLRWLMQRALSGGQEFARKTLKGAYGRVDALTHIQLFLRALLQSLAAACLALFFWPFSRHRAASWLIKLWANIGKLSVFFGWRYHEYASV
jgi:glycosyltransferase involved in cell wall biosynthesis